MAIEVMLPPSSQFSGLSPKLTGDPGAASDFGERQRELGLWFERSAPVGHLVSLLALQLARLGMWV